jgi:hypothetical protein
MQERIPAPGAPVRKGVLPPKERTLYMIYFCYRGFYPRSTLHDQIRNEYKRRPNLQIAYVYLPFHATHPLNSYASSDQNFIRQIGDLLVREGNLLESPYYDSGWFTAKGIISWSFGSIMEGDAQEIGPWTYPFLADWLEKTSAFVIKLKSENRTLRDIDIGDRLNFTRWALENNLVLSKRQTYLVPLYFATLVSDCWYVEQPLELPPNPRLPGLTFTCIPEKFRREAAELWLSAVAPVVTIDPRYDEALQATQCVYELSTQTTHAQRMKRIADERVQQGHSPPPQRPLPRSPSPKFLHDDSPADVPEEELTKFADAPLHRSQGGGLTSLKAGERKRKDPSRTSGRPQTTDPS